MDDKEEYAELMKMLAKVKFERCKDYTDFDISREYREETDKYIEAVNYVMTNTRIIINKEKR